MKRRVYDALNVLIAADVLKKDGKKVYSNEKKQKFDLKLIDFKQHPQKKK